eukprot:9911370-Ditylum_brightwellii.AAC.1
MIHGRDIIPICLSTGISPKGIQFAPSPMVEVCSTPLGLNVGYKGMLRPCKYYEPGMIGAPGTDMGGWVRRLGACDGVGAIGGNAVYVA